MFERPTLVLFMESVGKELSPGYEQVGKGCIRWS